MTTEYGSGISHIATGDFNDDGKLDIAFVANEIGSVGILLNACH